MEETALSRDSDVWPMMPDPLSWLVMTQKHEQNDMLTFFGISEVACIAR